jgi:hypothetical protein
MTDMQDLPTPDAVKDLPELLLYLPELFLHLPDPMLDLPEPMIDLRKLGVRRHVVELCELLTNINDLLADGHTGVIDGLIGHITNISRDFSARSHNKS